MTARTSRKQDASGGNKKLCHQNLQRRNVQVRHDGSPISQLWPIGHALSAERATLPTCRFAATNFGHNWQVREPLWSPQAITGLTVSISGLCDSKNRRARHFQQSVRRTPPKKSDTEYTACNFFLGTFAAAVANLNDVRLNTVSFMRSNDRRNS